MLFEDAQRFKALIGAGGALLQAQFTIVCAYVPRGVGTLTTDTLIGCTLTEIDKGYSQGNEPLAEKFSFKYLNQLDNGVPLLPF
jgi:hypothetical protein